MRAATRECPDVLERYGSRSYESTGGSEPESYEILRTQRDFTKIWQVRPSGAEDLQQHIRKYAFSEPNIFVRSRCVLSIS